MVKERHSGGFSDDCGVNEENERRSIEEEDDFADLNCGEWNQVELTSHKRKDRLRFGRNRGRRRKE